MGSGVSTQPLKKVWIYGFSVIKKEIFFKKISIGVRVSLQIFQLIPRTLKLTTM